MQLRNSRSSYLKVCISDQGDASQLPLPVIPVLLVLRNHKTSEVNWKLCSKIASNTSQEQMGIQSTGSLWSLSKILSFGSLNLYAPQPRVIRSDCSALHFFIHTAWERWHGPINEGSGLNQLLQSGRTLFMLHILWICIREMATIMHFILTSENCFISALLTKNKKLDWYYLFSGLQYNQVIWLLCLVL